MNGQGKPVRVDDNAHDILVEVKKEIKSKDQFAKPNFSDAIRYLKKNKK